MKKKTLNHWLTYVISVVTMIFNLSALAISTEHMHLPLTEAKALANGSIKWVLSADKGKRTLKMNAALSSTCRDSSGIKHSPTLSGVLEGSQAITLDLGNCQKRDDSGAIIASDADLSDEKFYTYDAREFSVELPTNFSGKVKVCHLKNGPASNDNVTINERMECNEIEIVAADDVSKKYLNESSLISDAEIAAVAAKEQEKIEEEKRKERLAAEVEEVMISVRSFADYCQENDLSGINSELATLVSLGLDLDEMDIREGIIEKIVGDLDKIESLRKLEEIYTELPSSKKEELSDDFFNAAMQITNERIDSIKEDVETTSVADVEEIVENAEDTVRDMFGRRMYKAKFEKAAPNMYSKAAQIMAKKDKTKAIALLENAKDGVSTKRNLEISQHQVDLATKLYQSCLSKANPRQAFDFAYKKCEKHVKAVAEIWEGIEEFAEESLDADNEEDLELLEEIQMAKFYMLGAPQVGYNGELQRIIYDAANAHMQKQGELLQQLNPMSGRGIRGNFSGGRGFSGMSTGRFGPSPFGFGR